MTNSCQPRIESAAPGVGPQISSSEWTTKFNPQGLIVDFDRLRVKPTPEGVDGAHLEAYLSDDQWKQFFKTTTRDEYYKMPAWQQLRLKKTIGLF